MALQWINRSFWSYIDRWWRENILHPEIVRCSFLRQLFSRILEIKLACTTSCFLLTKTRRLRHSLHTIVVTCAYFWNPYENTVSIWWQLWRHSSIFEYIQHVNLLFLLNPIKYKSKRWETFYACCDFDWSCHKRIEARCYLKLLTLKNIT